MTKKNPLDPPSRQAGGPGQGGVALCLKHAHEGEWQAGKSCLVCDRDHYKAEAERLRAKVAALEGEKAREIAYTNSYIKHLGDMQLDRDHYKAEAERLQASRDGWEADALRYAQNSDHWRAEAARLMVAARALIEKLAPMGILTREHGQKELDALKAELEVKR
jgi:hypothetical protein